MIIMNVGTEHRLFPQPYDRKLTIDEINDVESYKEERYGDLLKLQCHMIVSRKTKVVDNVVQQIPKDYKDARNPIFMGKYDEAERKEINGLLIKTCQKMK
jgi:hypothetical protein